MWSIRARHCLHVAALVHYIITWYITIITAANPLERSGRVGHRGEGAVAAANAAAAGVAARGSASTCTTGLGDHAGIARRRLRALGSAHRRRGRAKEHGHFAISSGH